VLLKYITVDHVACQAVLLGKGSLLAKIDIKLANCLIPVSPFERHYLGISWRNQIFVDGMLPFVLRSAPKIFNAVADALEWCINKAGMEHIYHYLDHFAVLGHPDTEQMSPESPYSTIGLCGPWWAIGTRKVSGP